MSSLNAFKGSSTFEYNGVELTLTFNNTALMNAEGILKESMMDFLPELMERIQFNANIQVRHIAALVFGGLKVNHPNITEKYVHDMVMSDHRDIVMRAMLDAMDGVKAPNVDGGIAKNPKARTKKARAGNGKKSI